MTDLGVFFSKIFTRRLSIYSHLSHPLFFFLWILFQQTIFLNKNIINYIYIYILLFVLLIGSVIVEKEISVKNLNSFGYISLSLFFISLCFGLDLGLRNRNILIISITILRNRFYNIRIMSRKLRGFINNLKVLNLIFRSYFLNYLTF